MGSFHVFHVCNRDFLVWEELPNFHPWPVVGICGESDGRPNAAAYLPSAHRGRDPPLYIRI